MTPPRDASTSSAIEGLASHLASSWNNLGGSYFTQVAGQTFKGSRILMA
jgi:hypothetical protein